MVLLNSPVSDHNSRLATVLGQTPIYIYIYPLVGAKQAYDNKHQAHASLQPRHLDVC